MTQAAFVKTTTREAERQWLEAIYESFNLTRTLDYSNIYTAQSDHPWIRDDLKFIIPSGTPLAIDAGASGLDTQLVFPVKRTELAVAAPVGTEVTYTLKEANSFIVGDELFLAGGTARAITAINYTTKVATVGTTIGVTALVDAAIYTVNKDTALGLSLNAIDLSVGAYDAICSMLQSGRVFHQIIHSQIFGLAALVKTNLETAGVKFIMSAGTQI